MSWTKIGNIMGPRGESVVSIGPEAPASADDGDVALLTGEDGALDGVGIYSAGALYPSDDL